MDLEANGSPPKTKRPRGGYASLSSFMVSDKSFLIFRRFDNVAARNLLYMQDELCEIEQQIKELDDADMVSTASADLYSLHSRRFDKNKKRVALVRQSAEKLKAYEEAILRRSAMLAIPKPLDRDVASLANWMTAKKPTVEEESHFLDNRADLIPLMSGQDQRSSLEDLLGRYCYKFFATAKHRAKTHAATDPTYVYYYSLTTIRRVVRLLAMLAAVLAVTGPPFALYFIARPVVRLALIVAFAMVFATVLATTTNCKNQEVFAITAALVHRSILLAAYVVLLLTIVFRYAAVMVVFIGNNPGCDGCLALGLNQTNASTTPT